jgi:predicted AlkP superfamily phosphohydrolase/phosphomutase
MKKVIVIGLDGFEPTVVERLLKLGELPSLATLRGQGGYARLRTTYPALTPVAWSTFATGTNPGGHGIFDFIRRDPNTYLPDFSLNRYEQRHAYLPPKAVNLRRGMPVWEVLAAAGISSTLIRCPCTYPPDAMRGRMLAGMGVPDLRGGLGTSTFYSSAGEIRSRENETVVRLRKDGSHTIRTHLIGPRNPKTGSDFQAQISLHLTPSAKRVILQSEGHPKALEIREGEWSDWLHVKFKTGLLQSVSGMVRFYLVRLEPVFELYASPVNFDPEAPLFPISFPAEYARDLARTLGTFYTTGMVEDHAGLNNGRFGEAAYLAQCEEVLREREQMMRYELEGLEEGLLFCLFDTPDRVQHMFWRFGEAGHPANHGDEAPAMARVIEEHYRACDTIVGTALHYADEHTLLIVLSDHGMNSFQRGVHLNTWLHDQGWLALRNGVRPSHDTGDFFQQVDWSRTQAYALGMGGVYLNRKGREARGIIEASQVDAVKAAIASGLTGLCDSERGKIAVRSVVTREQIYTGPYADESPDLLVNFAQGYRVSWATALGGVPAGHFEDNAKKWGGDHIIDPCLIPGVLFMNRPFHEQNVSLLDMAPTILAALGVPRGAAMEGRSRLI